jgi:hypothetical protein
MVIANIKTEITFVLRYIVTEKVFQYVRRNQYELQTEAPGFILCMYNLLILPYLFRNRSV